MRWIQLAGLRRLMNTCYMSRVDGTANPAIADPMDNSEFGICQHWTITRINVPEAGRGKGYGTALLLRVLREADREEAVLCLGALASGANTGGLTQRQLVAWHGRHGFVKQPKGSRCDMVRQPLAPVSESE